MTNDAHPHDQVTFKQKDIRLFLKAAKKGDVLTVKNYIARGMSPDVTDNKGETALFYAARAKNFAVIDALVDAGCDLDHRRKGDHYGVLHVLMYKTWSLSDYLSGPGKVALYVVKKGADVNLRDADGNTPSHILAYMLDFDGGLKGFIQNTGADPALINSVGEVPAQIFLDRKKKKAAAELFEYMDSLKKKELSATQPTVTAIPPIQEKPAQKTEEPADSARWSVTAQQEITRITENKVAGYKLTEIFNFETGLYSRLARNLSTDAESQVLRDFQEFSSTVLLEKAAREYAELTNTDEEPFLRALHVKQPLKLDKPAF